MTETIDTDAVIAAAQIHWERAVWYAWGRLDGGHPAIVQGAGETVPSSTSTVFRFGDLYRSMWRDYIAERTYFAAGVVTAWERFVDTNGERITSD